ncbi:MAG TPA: hypothetical protein VJ983_05360 [candidate division Zixibacteria bacterium]|nr:hypothetical protein [candidate division Zixibacteria bacterium]
MPVHDYVITFALFISLAAVAARRKQLIGVHGEGYRNIAAGLVILNFASLLRIYYEQAMLASVPFLAEPLFFRLTYWTFVLTGATLLVSGMSSWLPIARKSRQFNFERVQRLELLKQLRQLVRVESRIPVVLEKSLAHMISDYQLQCGQVYAISQTTGAVKLIASECPSEDEDHPMPVLAGAIRSTLSNGDLKHVTPGSLTDGDSTSPSELVPVTVGTKPSALFVLWTTADEQLHDEDKTILKLAADIIADQVELERTGARRAFDTELQRERESLKRAVARDSDIKSTMTTLAGHLRRAIDFDIMQLAVEFADGGTERLTLGENLAVLSEKNVTMNDVGSVLDCLPKGVNVSAIDVTSRQELTDSQILRAGDIRTLVVISTKESAGSSQGTILLGLNDSLRLSPKQSAYLNMFSEVLTERLSREDLSRQIVAAQARSEKFESLVRASADDRSTGEFLGAVAAFIGRELKADAVRIVTRDADKAFVTSQALCLNRSAEPVIPGNGSLILSLMPGLSAVLETGRSTAIDQNDPERMITEVEASQIFVSGMTFGLMVPIQLSRRTVGAVLVAADNREAISTESLRFVETVTAVLGMRLSRLVLSDETGEASEYRNRVIATNSDLRNRVRSSLAGIAGSVEYIREKNGTTISGSMEKCLSIIDRSVKRLTDYVAP